jgi:osmotically-inducible protein OsmY
MDASRQLQARQRRIASRVRAAFRRYGYSQLNGISFELKGPSLVLSGKVPSEYLRQVAESIAMSLPEVSDVANEITVTRAASADTPLTT